MIYLFKMSLKLLSSRQNSVQQKRVKQLQVLMSDYIMGIGPKTLRKECKRRLNF